MSSGLFVLEVKLHLLTFFLRPQQGTQNYANYCFHSYDRGMQVFGEIL